MDYISCEAAIKLSGLRLVLSAGSPNPWGESAKNIFHVKRLSFVAVRHQGMGDNDEIFVWTGTRNAPVAIFNDEKPRHAWIEILYLAERLGNGDPLLPQDREGQVECIGLSHQICGEDGLGWNRRLDLFHMQVQAAGGDATKTILPARMFRDFNGTTAGMAASTGRTIEILNMFDTRLTRQKALGSAYLIGDHLTACDIYLASFMGMLAPLAPENCPMPEMIRQFYCSGEVALRQAVTPALLAHRDFIYASSLKLPMDF